MVVVVAATVIVVWCVVFVHHVARLTKMSRMVVVFLCGLLLVSIMSGG